MRVSKHQWFTAVLAVFIAFGLANAQPNPVPPKNELTQSPATVLEATQRYRASSEELLNIQKTHVSQATAKLDELRKLVAEGLVAKSELEENEQSLAALRAQLEGTQKQIAESDSMIAELQAEQETVKAAAVTPIKLISKQYGVLNTTATLLRYDGRAPWSLEGLGGIQAFFSSTFGHPLPTSAVGQTETHNRLGYDHRNAVDVALPPDSSEGKVLIKYLQGKGIPFLAFRAAVPGIATGPHIHIGSPSHRLS